MPQRTNAVRQSSLLTPDTERRSTLPGAELLVVNLKFCRVVTDIRDPRTGDREAPAGVVTNRESVPALRAESERKNVYALEKSIGEGALSLFAPGGDDAKPIGDALFDPQATDFQT